MSKRPAEDTEIATEQRKEEDEAGRPRDLQSSAHGRAVCMEGVAHRAVMRAKGPLAQGKCWRLDLVSTGDGIAIGGSDDAMESARGVSLLHCNVKTLADNSGETAGPEWLQARKEATRTILCGSFLRLFGQRE